MVTVPRQQKTLVFNKIHFWVEILITKPLKCLQSFLYCSVDKGTVTWFKVVTFVSSYRWENLQRLKKAKEEELREKHG